MFTRIESPRQNPINEKNNMNYAYDSKFLQHSVVTSGHKNDPDLPTRSLHTSAALRCDGFVKSGRTRLALGLGGGGAACDSVLTRRTLRVGGTRVDYRRGRVKKSWCARLALGLRGSGSSSSYVHVFARGAQS